MNHRLRFGPHAEREDVMMSWRLWTPTPESTIYLPRAHVVAGYVRAGDGAGMPGATVCVGSLPDPRYSVISPEWRTTTTNGEGFFRFRNLPMTRDRHIDVWAVPGGAPILKTSRDVVGAVSARLDERQVVLTLR